LVAQIKCSPEWSHFGSSTYPHLFQNATKLKKKRDKHEGWKSKLHSGV
jgi:hypothetical protein